MRRLTRRIGLFGGPGAMMPAVGADKKPSGTPEPQPRTEPSAPAEASPQEKAKPRSWLDRILGPKS